MGLTFEASSQTAPSVPKFLKRYVDSSGKPKPLSAEHKQWMMKESQTQLAELQKGQADKKQALISQANQSQSVCHGFKSFDPQFTDSEFKDCLNQMQEVQKFLVESLQSMNKQEIDDAYAIALKRLEAAASGKELSAREEIELFQSTNGFQQEFAKLTPEEKGKYKQLISLYDDPEFLKAVESNDEQKILKILKDKNIEWPSAVFE